MKNLIKLFGIIALAALIGLSFVGCPSPGGEGGEGGTPPYHQRYYECKDSDGNVYTLEITGASVSRAAYTPKPGDTYVLTITLKAGGTEKSSGTVDISGTTFILKPNNSETTFTITVTTKSDAVLITGITGNITLEDGTTKTAPSSSSIIKVAVYDSIGLWSVWGEDPGTQHWWNIVLALSDFTGETPVKGKKYTFTVSGTPDKALNNFSIGISCQPEDWSVYTDLGGWDDDGHAYFPPLPKSVTFNKTFTIPINEDPTPGWLIWINITNYAPIPASVIKQGGAIMATIRNFKISLDKVE